MHVTTINENIDMDLKESKQGCMGGFEGKKGKILCNYIII